MVSALKSYLWYFQRQERIFTLHIAYLGFSWDSKEETPKSLLKAVISYDFDVGLNIFDGDFDQPDIRIYTHK